VEEKRDLEKKDGHQKTPSPSPRESSGKSPSQTPSSPKETLPPQTTPSQKSPSLTPKKKGILALILGAVLLLVGLGGVLAVAYQGVEIPLISKELSFKMQGMYAKLPLVPKKPRHILILSLESSLEVATFTLDASLGMMDFDFALFGEAESKEEEANFDLHLSARSNNLTYPLSLEMDLISFDKIFYFKVDTLASPLFSMEGADYSEVIEAITGQWWQWDFGALETQAREELGTQTATERVQEKMIEIFSHPEIVGAITKGEDEKVGEETSYHLRFIPTKETFLKLIEVFQGSPLSDRERENYESSFEGIEKLEIDLWIGRETLVVRKVAVVYKLSPSLGGMEASPYDVYSLLFTNQMEGAFVLELPTINQAVSITAPEGARAVEEMVEILVGSPGILGEEVEAIL
jgi:hypothetical protein